MDTIIISPIGEPGSGKSTFSFWLVQALKLRGVRAEFVPEVIKYRSYSPAAMAKVSSGNFDERLLRQQHSFTKPLIGQVEVIVNDGALPPFYYYSLQRVASERLPGLRAQLDRYLAEQAGEHRYVTTVRHHAYDTHGRRQDETESQAMRAQLLGTLEREFGITPTVVGDSAWRERYADSLAQEVLARRAAPAERAVARRRPGR